MFSDFCASSPNDSPSAENDFNSTDDRNNSNSSYSRHSVQVVFRVSICIINVQSLISIFLKLYLLKYIYLYDIF